MINQLLVQNTKYMIYMPTVNKNPINNHVSK